MFSAEIIQRATPEQRKRISLLGVQARELKLKIQIHKQGN